MAPLADLASARRRGGRRAVRRRGAAPPAELNRVFFLQLSVLGSTMGTRTELEALLRFLVTSGIRPEIDRVYPLADARQAFERLASGHQFGKIVLTP